MSRDVPEWIAKHDNEAIPPRVRLRVFQRSDGRCALCTRPLRPDHWECDHIISLINGGQHREKNLQALCDEPCHSNKTKRDVAEKSHVYKRAASNVGIKKPRSIRAWRKFDGTPVFAERER